jgi:hypothetical protein
MKLQHLLSFFALATSLFADEPPAGFTSLFNGKDLTGWNGEPGRWSVEDGAITGTVVPENPLKSNSFLIWQGGEKENFELRMKVRWPKWDLSKGMRNSGIQIRSVVLPAVHPWSVGGYQFDLSPGGELDASFYEERSQRPLGVAKGDRVVIQPDGERWRLATIMEQTELNALRKPETEWSECGIVVVGNHVTYTMNGKTVMELTDHDERYRRLRGIIALQIHIGGAMKVQFKDLWFKELPAGGIEAPLAKVPSDAVNAGAESLRSSASNLLKSHDAKKLSWAQDYKPGITRVWPKDADFERFASGDANSVSIVAPTPVDLDSWNKLATDNKAEWMEKPCSTLVTKLPDGSEARLPVASVHGRYFFASLGTGTAQPEKPATGFIPLDGKAPDAIPAV